MPPLSPAALRQSRRRHRPVPVILFALVVLATTLGGERPVEQRVGRSGAPYAVFRESVRWSPRGSAVTLRYRSRASSCADAAHEALDLLPRLARHADGAGIERVTVQANAPLVRLGAGAGVYREWRFRFVRDGAAWRRDSAAAGMTNACRDAAPVTG